MQEQELFQGYELKGWEPSGRLYKILGVSTLVSLLSLLVVGQTQLLTTKGCDSPFVGQVCNVLDTLYVGGNVIATDADYVNKDYVPNELADAEITMIDVSNQFKYPEGYFALSNPELTTPTFDPNNPNSGFLPDASGTIPGIPNPTTGGTGDLLNQPQQLPQANDSAVIGQLPTSPLGTDNPTVTAKVPRPRWSRKTPKNPTVANNSPDSLPNLTKNPTTAENKEPKTDPTQNQTGVNSNPVKDAVEINKKPLKDFAANVKAKYDKKEVDLTQPFTVVAEGLIGSDGKLDTSIDPKTKQPKSRFIKWEGNEQMIEVAKQAFEAVGNSGWLAHLRGQGIEKINFTIVQDNDNLKVLITSEMPTPQRAETISSGVNNLISVPLTLDKNGFKKLGDDERTLLSNAKSSFNGKLFTLDFVLPKQTAQEMITRKLNEPVTEENKPQSTALASENNKAATK